MPLSPRPLACGIVTAALLILATGGCSGTHPQAAAAATQSAAGDPLQVKLSQALRKQVTVGEVHPEPVSKVLKATGRVEANEEHLARIGSPVTGRISEVLVEHGQFVRRGEALATVSSTELANTQLTFLEAYSRQQLAEQAVGRAEQLLKADVIGSAELQRRKAELLEKIEEVSASRAQLEVLGMARDAIDELQRTRSITSTSRIVASVSGTVLERKATVGQVVPPAETLFVIADLSAVWVVADIPEESAGNLRAGKSVAAEIAAFPGEPVIGRLAFVSPTVNPETRSVGIRMDLPNPHHRYKPDMLATISLKDAGTLQEVVPATAVVREENKSYLFVQTAPDEFRLREVTLGTDLENRYALVSGLQPGEKIVLDGAFHLNNERKRLALGGVQ